MQGTGAPPPHTPCLAPRPHRDSKMVPGVPYGPKPAPRPHTQRGPESSLWGLTGHCPPAPLGSCPPGAPAPRSPQPWAGPGSGPCAGTTCSGVRATKSTDRGPWAQVRDVGKAWAHSQPGLRAMHRGTWCPCPSSFARMPSGSAQHVQASTWQGSCAQGSKAGGVPTVPLGQSMLPGAPTRGPPRQERGMHGRDRPPALEDIGVWRRQAGAQ